MNDPLFAGRRFEILWEWPKLDTVKWSESMLQEKWHQQTCLAQGDHRPSIVKIAISAKCIKVMGDKMRHACLSILEDVGILGPE